jgi:subtilisin-like proprotein convertase family protein
MRLLIATALVASGCTSFEVADADDPDTDAGVREVSAESRPASDIPDGSDIGVTDTADIDEPCTIDSVAIDVEIRHPWRGDVSVSVVSAAGTEIVLKNYVDEDGADDVIGTFPDTLLPVQSLDGLAGEQGMGQWVLKVSDLDTDDIGTLEAWAVHLDCT